MGKPKVLTFGNVVTDGLYRVRSMPGYDEKTFAESASWAPGGPAVHFALAAAGLGAEAGVLGWIGADSFGRQIEDTLRGRGVFPLLQRIPGVHTPTAVVMVDMTGEKAVLLSPPIEDAKLPPVQSLPGVDLAQTHHVHTHLFIESYVRRVLEAANRLGVSTSLDIEPSSVRRWGAETVRRLLPLVNTVFINETAVGLLCPGNEELESQLSAIAELGPSTVVCTRGSKGSVALSDGRLLACPAIRVFTKNSLAAGDIFAGVFVTTLLTGADTETAIRRATAASSVSVSRSDNRVHYPSPADIEEALGRYDILPTIREVKKAWKSI